ncbi:PstS family phosphate ABC transporter substrate-binding protein [Vibrio sp. WJH972]
MKIATLILTLCCYSLSAFSASELRMYQKSDDVGGSLLSVGSDTLAGITTLWAEEFKNIYPNIDAQVQASGSSTAPPALTEGTAQFGAMSRPMRAREVDAFEHVYGYKPTQLRVAVDAIGIFVHKDNPIEGLTFTQLDQIFSATLRCGGNRTISNWAELGIRAPWAQRAIQMFSRNSVSGTYGYFKQNVLCEGDFKNNVNEQPGSASVVQSVASSINSIGYSGVGYSVSEARVLPIASVGDDFIAPTHKNIVNGRYPLSRYLYVYINKHPQTELSPLVREFVQFIFSKQGQGFVVKEGYVPISADIAQTELKKIGL